MQIAQRVAFGIEPSWGQLDPELALALHAGLPALTDEIVTAIGEAIPEYRRPLEGAFGRGVRVGVRRALEQFLRLVEHGELTGPSDRDIYRELGRGELRAGRSLDALQAAYRLGSRISWRRVSSVARERGADAATVSLLAESMFAHIEEISASSVEGYAQAQAELAGERDRRRRRLVRMLVERSEAIDEHALRLSALDAEWELPATLAVLLCEADDVNMLVTLIGADAIGARVDELACVLVCDPDAPARRSQLEKLLRRRQLIAALGPTVPSAETHLSFRRASTGLELVRRGVFPAEGLLVCEEHLLALLLFGDPELGDELVRRSLAPLELESPGSRKRLRQTLASWLRHQGSVPAIASELHVHRQTVRYRLSRLKELFGELLEDPDRRLEIELALRVTQR
jgi:PucR-like helix-turn-helix protein